MRFEKLKGQRGASLTEMLVVFALTAVLVSFAVSQFGSAEEVFKTQNIARELKVNLERARFDSVKRRPVLAANEARVIIESPTKFSVSLDRNNNGTLETSDKNTVDLQNTGDMRILTQGLSLPVTVSFDHRGKATAVDSIGNTLDPKFTVCDNCTPITVSSDNAYVVEVSPTGTIAMYRFGDPVDTLSVPTVGNISATGDVDPMVSHTGGPAPVGTPAITPTPDPTPSVTPTPSPTPMPTPTGNPTPTPNADICYRNERPAESGCICESPMWVHENGQCK